ncbi:MAG: ATPase domain-containing protein [Zestosphaera sp.]
MEALDKLLGNFIVPPYVMIVAGHPGSGKTTLASTICYHNALRGHKCIYISFQEDKEKLFTFMGRLGLDLRGVEAKGLFKFIRIPVTLDMESSVEMLKLIGMEGYDIVVVDSINALLASVGDDAAKRAWLQNYFYNLPQVTNGLGVLIAEVPYGQEGVQLGGIEFVADAILVMKHRIEDEFLVRLLEVRKVRGAPASLAEVPFTISGGRGIEVMVPPVLEDVALESGEARVTCDVLRKTLNHLHRGQVVNFVHPPDSDHPELLTLLLSIAVENGMRVLIISYRYTKEVLKESIVRTLTAHGIDSKTAEEIVNRYVVFRGINPFSYNETQLVAKELELVDSADADIVVFHSVCLVRHLTDIAKHVKDLYNQMNYLRNRGKLVARIGAFTDDLTYRLESRVADAVMRFEHEGGNVGKIGYKAFISRRNRKPCIVTQNEMEECFAEAVKSIKAKLLEGKVSKQ